MNVITTLTLLIESLDKKKEAQAEILNYTKAQATLLNSEKFELKAFDNIMKNKQFRIDTIKQIDDGFKPSYERIRGSLEKNPALYADYISSLKERIKIIGDLSINIQVLEEKNFNKFKVLSEMMKENVKTFRTSKKTVNNYYQNYNKQHESVRENFFDSKK